MINRHNYEEFFLLYVDNELSPEERTAVELFVQQHPDLAAELETLQQSVLLPEEDLVFTAKASLIKSGDAINTGNYEEFFLLYVDNELDQPTRASVEKFVLQHPELQDAFTLLNQVKLQPETIVFPDKQLLLRKEKTRVVPFTWKQLAVAAILIGLAILVWVVVPGNKETGDGQLVQQQTIHPLQQDQQVTAGNNQQDVQQPVELTPAIEPANANVATTRKPLKQANRQQPVEPVQVQYQAGINNREMTAPVQPAIEQELLANNSKPLTGESPVVVAMGTDNTNAIDAETDLIAVAQTSYAETAVYRELNTDEDYDRNTMYVGSVGLNKNKVKGIMKKFGGMFAGKSKEIAETNPGTIQVAGFELNTK